MTSVDREGDKPLFDPGRRRGGPGTGDGGLHRAQPGGGLWADRRPDPHRGRGGRRTAPLSPRVSVQLLTPEDAPCPWGPVIVPACLAKGLEFDAVMVYDAGKRMDGMELLLHTPVHPGAAQPSPLCAGPEGFASVIAGMDPSTHRTEA